MRSRHPRRRRPGPRGRRSWGASIASSPAGKAASIPKRTPGRRSALRRTRPPQCRCSRQKNSEMPIVRNARSASSGVGCASANAVDSSIMRWLEARARRRTPPRSTRASESAVRRCGARSARARRTRPPPGACHPRSGRRRGTARRRRTRAPRSPQMSHGSTPAARREDAERGADQRCRERRSSSAVRSSVRSVVAIGRHHAGAPPEHEPARRPYDPGVTLDPGVFKAYDVRGVVPDELDADGAYRIARAYVDEFEPSAHRRRPRHAPDLGGALRGGDPRRPRRRLRRRRHRPRRHRDDVLRRRRARLRGRLHDHRLAQSRALQRAQDGATRRAARRRRLGPRPRARARPAGRVPHARQARRAQAARRPRRVRRSLPVGHRPIRDLAAERRDRRGQRHGRLHDHADPRSPADRGRALPLRARRQLPALRAEPAAAREPRVHRQPRARDRAPISASRSTATAIAASSSTTPASSCPATSSPR